MQSKVLTKAEIALDHLILGIADLTRGIDWLEKRTGVRATPGGNHPGAGTQNALVSLGGRRYLEIMSIDPNQIQANWLAARIRELETPQLLTWAAATSNIGSLGRTAEDAGFRIEGPGAGSRLTPGGGKLEWKILRVITEFGSVIPFFIEWGAGVVHPSIDSPRGCTIEGLEIGHPEAGRVREVLGSLGVEAEIVRAPEPRLKAALRTPKGQVCLT